MVFVMYGVVLLSVFIAVAVAAIKDSRLSKAAAGGKRLVNHRRSGAEVMVVTAGFAAQA